MADITTSIQPNDPSQFAEPVGVTPQALQAAKGIAQNVAQSSGSPAPAQPSALSKFASGTGNILLSALQGFAMARMGQDAVGLQLRKQYQQELMDRELATKEKLAKEQAQQQFLAQGIQNQGSAFLNNPKIKKLIGLDNLPLYEQMGKAVDAQKANIQKALIAAHIDPSLANLPPEAMKMIQQNQAFQQKQQFEAQKQQFEQTKEGAELAKEGFSLQKAKIELTKAGVELEKSLQEKSDKATQKQQDALQKFVDGLGKNRDGLLAKYNALNADGSPKYDDKAKQAAMDNWNKSLDAQKKRAEQAGIDLGQYKLDYSAGDAGYKVLGHKFGGTPGTLGQSAPDTAPQVPTGEGAANASFNPAATVKSKSGRHMTKGKDGKWYYADSSTS